MEIKKCLKSILLTGGLALGTIGCGDNSPYVKELKDLTGDGIPDVIIDYCFGSDTIEYLFIGRENGTFDRAKGITENSETRYYRKENGDFYFFDGEIYRLSPGKKSTPGNGDL
ncbi:MAG: hypothetical protein ABIF88_03080 [archaeon]